MTNTTVHNYNCCLSCGTDFEMVLNPALHAEIMTLENMADIISSFDNLCEKMLENGIDSRMLKNWLSAFEDDRLVIESATQSTFYKDSSEEVMQVADMQATDENRGQPSYNLEFCYTSPLNFCPVCKTDLDMVITPEGRERYNMLRKYINDALEFTEEAGSPLSGIWIEMLKLGIDALTIESWVDAYIDDYLSIVPTKPAETKGVKLWFDGGCLNNGKADSDMSIGFQILSEEPINGSRKYQYGNRIGSGSSTIAEYSALIAGLEYLRKYSYSDHIDIYGDSQIAINQINGASKCKDAQCKQLLEKAIDLLSQFDGYSISWIPRCQNSIADSIGRIRPNKATFRKR